MSANRSWWSSPTPATSPRTRPSSSLSITRFCHRPSRSKQPSGLTLPGSTTTIDLVDGRLNNVNAHVVQVKGDGRRFDEIAAGAAAVIKRRFYYDHGASAPMETRGVVAEWDYRVAQLTIWDTTQAPVFLRNGMAAMLGLSENQVRVIAPFIGGGFGPKIMMFYPEEMLVPWLAMQLKRPVKWIEDRAEHFVATTNERDQIHYAEMAVAADGKILAVRDRFLHDAGAYAPYGLTVPLNSQCTLLGCYDIPTYHSTFTSVFTNKTIVDPVSRSRPAARRICHGAPARHSRQRR